MAKLPLPDEQPVAVNALRNKRSRLAGEIEMHSREIDRLRSEIVHLDFVLKLFEPQTEPDAIPALQYRQRRTEWFARGEVTRRIYDEIREHGTVLPRDLAKRAMAEKGIPEIDRRARQDIINRFANICHDLTRRGRLTKIGHGPGARWKLAPIEPELI
jgi:hypothetical protein